MRKRGADAIRRRFELGQFRKLILPSSPTVIDDHLARHIRRDVLTEIFETDITVIETPGRPLVAVYF